MVNNSLSLNLVFGALSDPTRRRILEMVRAGEKSVTDLARPFRISLPAVSKHLRVLERAGLLTRTKEGRVHRMRSNPEAVQEARQWMDAYVQGWDQSFDALERFLAENHPPTPQSDDD